MSGMSFVQRAGLTPPKPKPKPTAQVGVGRATLQPPPGNPILRAAGVQRQKSVMWSDGKDGGDSNPDPAGVGVNDVVDTGPGPDTDTGYTPVKSTPNRQTITTADTDGFVPKKSTPNQESYTPEDQGTGGGGGPDVQDSGPGPVTGGPITRTLPDQPAKGPPPVTGGPITRQPPSGGDDVITINDPELQPTPKPKPNPVTAAAGISPIDWDAKTAALKQREEASPVMGNVGVAEAQRRVQDEETMGYQLGKVLDQNNPLFQRARDKALAISNRRGMANSSMATQAGEEAVMGQATNIAGFDANAYQAAAGQNLAAKSQQNIASAQIQGQLESQRYATEAAVKAATVAYNRNLDLTALNLNSQQQIALMQEGGLDRRQRESIAAQFGLQKNQLDSSTSQQDKDIAAKMEMQQRDLEQQAAQWKEKLGIDLKTLDQQKLQFESRLNLDKDALAQQNALALSQMSQQEKLETARLAQQNSQFIEQMAFSKEGLNQQQQQFLADLAVKKDGLSQQDKQFMANLAQQQGALDQNQVQFLAKLALDEKALAQQGEIAAMQAATQANALNAQMQMENARLTQQASQFQASLAEQTAARNQQNEQFGRSLAAQTDAQRASMEQQNKQFYASLDQNQRQFLDSRGWDQDKFAATMTYNNNVLAGNAASNFSNAVANIMSNPNMSPEQRDAALRTFMSISAGNPTLPSGIIAGIRNVFGTGGTGTTNTGTTGTTGNTGTTTNTNDGGGGGNRGGG